MSRSGHGYLLLSTVLLQAAYSLIRPWVTYRALEVGLDDRAVAILAGSFSWLPLAFAFYVGRRADRMDARLLALYGSGLVIVGTVGTFFGARLVVLVAATAVLGLGHLMTIVGWQAVTARTGDPERGYSHQTSAGALGQVLGPILGGVLGSHVLLGAMTRAQTILVVGAVLAAGAFVASARYPAALKRPVAVRDSAAGALRQTLRLPGMWQALVVSGVVLAALDILAAFLPYWGEQHNISTTIVGLLLSLRAAVTVAGRLASGGVTRRWSLRAIIVVCAGASGLAFVSLISSSVWVAAAAMVVLGLGLGLPQPSTMAWVANVTDERHRGAAVGMRLTANRISQVAISLGVSLFPRDGSSAVFVMMAFFLGASAVTAATSGNGDGSSS